MTDDLDPDIAARFDALAHVPVPDLWGRVSAEAATDHAADARDGRRWGIAAAIVLLLGGLVLAIAFVSRDGSTDEAIENRPTLPPSADGDYRGRSEVSQDRPRLPEDPQERWRIRSPHGWSGQVVVIDDVVVFAQQTGVGGDVGLGIDLVAVARTDGAERWTTRIDGAGGREPSAKIHVVDGVVLASVTSLTEPFGTTFFGIDPATGVVLWQKVDTDDDGVTYNSGDSTFIRSFDEGGLERISAVTGEALRAIPPLAPEARPVVDNVLLAQIAGTVVTAYDINDLDVVIPPTDLGREVDEVIDAGDLIVAFDQSAHQLLAFDRSGRLLDSLEMAAPDRADDQSSDLSVVLADRPTVVRLSARGQEVVEFSDGVLHIVASFEYRNGSVVHAGGRTLYVAEDTSTGESDVVDLTSGELLASYGGFVDVYANGVITVVSGSDDASTGFGAVGFDGASLWPSGLTDLINSTGQPNFLDGAVFVWFEENGEFVASFWE